MDGLEVQPHILQHLLHQHCRQEPVERLLSTAVGIVHQIRQRIDHCARQRRRISQLQPRLVRPPLRRHCHRERRPFLVQPDHAAEGIRLDHPVYIHRETHLHRIRLLVSQRLHPHHSAPLAHRLDPPVHPRLATRLNLHAPHLGINKLQTPALQFQLSPYGLLRLEVVVNIGGQHHLILFDKEPRRLQPEQEILRCHHRRRSFADLGPVPHRPRLDRPPRQILRHLEPHLDNPIGVRHQPGIPIRRIRKILPHHGFDNLLAHRTSRGLFQFIRHPRFSGRHRHHRHGCRHGVSIHIHPVNTLRCPFPRWHRHPDRTTSPRKITFLPHLLHHPFPENPEIGHQYRLGKPHIERHPVNVGFRLRIMVPPPFPEERLDLINVRAPRNILHRLVIHADHQRPRIRLAEEIGHPQLHRRLLARLVRRRRW